MPFKIDGRIQFFYPGSRALITTVQLPRPYLRVVDGEREMRPEQRRCERTKNMENGMNMELIDVTESARKHVIQFPDWRVAVTRRVWDQWVATPVEGEGPGEGTRLRNILGYLWAGLKQVATPDSGFIDGFGFIGCAANGIRESREVGLTAFPMIGSDGSPYMVVMTPEEGPRLNAMSSEAVNVH
jgi:hypothetical protein